MDDYLRGEGAFTVFAPTDEAFAKLPDDTLNALFQDKEKLTAVLTSHVAPGSLRAADVINRDNIRRSAVNVGRRWAVSPGVSRLARGSRGDGTSPAKVRSSLAFLRRYRLFR